MARFITAHARYALLSSLVWNAQSFRIAVGVLKQAAWKATVVALMIRGIALGPILEIIVRRISEIFVNA